MKNTLYVNGGIFLLLAVLTGINESIDTGMITLDHIASTLFIPFPIAFFGMIWTAVANAGKVEGKELLATGISLAGGIAGLWAIGHVVILVGTLIG